jgi:hypothetical protein
MCMSEQINSPEFHQPNPEERGVLRAVALRIHEVRVSRLENKLSERKETDMVIRAAPEQTRLIRGFGKPHDSPSTVPIKRTEKLAYHRREAQTAKSRRRDREAWRSDQVHGGGGEERQSKAEKRSEKRSAKRVEAIHEKNSNKDEKFKRAKEGKTTHAKYRAMRINRIHRKLEELQQKHTPEENTDSED